MAERAAVARGVSALACDAVHELSRLVEAMHANVAAVPLPLGRGTAGRTRGVTGLVYESIRVANGAVRATLERGLAHVRGGPAPRGPRAEAWLAALNGVLGDHLAASRNPLALPMRLRSGGRALPLEREALAAALPAAGPRVLLRIHGLCMNDRQWARRGHDPGGALARELGFTPLELAYNSGRHVSENGRELAVLLERLVAAWPVGIEELAVLGHSMGGLVARSACRQGGDRGHAWVGRLRRLVFLGTPHHGAPLERAGRWLHGALGVSPYTAPLARLGALRSAGITDLRHGNLLDADWRGCDRFALGGDRRAAVPLPPGVACYAVAGTLGPGPIGDGLVPLASALGRHRRAERTLAFPEAHTWVGRGLGHLDLLDRPEVYARLAAWLG